jgi:hypothetical protein
MLRINFAGQSCPETRAMERHSVSEHLHNCRRPDLVFWKLRPILHDMLADTVMVPTGLYLTDDPLGTSLDVSGNDERSSDETLDSHNCETESLLCPDRDANLLDRGNAGVGEVLLKIIDNIRVWGKTERDIGHGCVEMET